MTIANDSRVWELNIDGKFNLIVEDEISSEDE